MADPTELTGAALDEAAAIAMGWTLVDGSRDHRVWNAPNASATLVTRSFVDWSRVPDMLQWLRERGYTSTIHVGLRASVVDIARPIHSTIADCFDEIDHKDIPADLARIVVRVHAQEMAKEAGK